MSSFGTGGVYIATRRGSQRVSFFDYGGIAADLAKPLRFAVPGSHSLAPFR